MSLTKQIAKQVAKEKCNTVELQLGDFVQHSISGITGVVTEISTMGDITLLSIQTMTGRRLTKLNRQEFVLAPKAALFQQIEKIAPSTEVVVMEGVVGDSYTVSQDFALEIESPVETANTSAYGAAAVEEFEFC